MALRVKFSALARVQLLGIVHRKAEASPERAVRWAEGLHAEIASLATFPRRCPVALDYPGVANPVRELTYGKKPPNRFRIFFQIDNEAIRVVAIYNSQQEIDPTEADPLI